jgi:hypothetical protein
MSLEHDIRTTLDRRAGEATISPDAWSRIEERITAGDSPIQLRPPPNGQPRRYLMLAAAVLVVALVAGSVARRSIEETHKVRTGRSQPAPTVVSDTPSTTPDASTSTTSAPTTTSAPPPTSTPPPPSSEPTTSPLNSSSRVTMVGIGPVEEGMSLSEATRVTGQTFAIDPSSFIGGEPGVGCGYARAEGFSGASFMVNGDVIVRVDVADRGIKTVSGIGIGSTEAEVKATYDGVTVEGHAYTPGWHYLMFEAPGDHDHLLLFETDGTTVRNFRSGLRNPVLGTEGCA